MYLVVSFWETVPGHEEEFERAGTRMRAIMLAQPGVEFVEAFASNGKTVAVHGYTDEAAYNAIVNDSDGPFVSGAAETGIENHARWISSERGVTKPHD